MYGCLRSFSTQTRSYVPQTAVGWQSRPNGWTDRGVRGGAETVTSGLLPDWRVACPFPSSPPALSWHDLFPWQPLPPSIHAHGHLWFPVIHGKVPRRVRNKGWRRRSRGLADDSSSGASVPARGWFFPATQQSGAAAADFRPPRVNKHRVGVRANCSARIT